MRNAIPACVYVMESDDGLVKLGRSRDPEQRRKTLEWGTGRTLRVCHTTPIRDDSSYVEAAAHRLLVGQRKVGEWFNVTVDDAVQAIEAAIIEVEQRKADLKPKGRRPWRIDPDGPCRPFSLRVPEEMARSIETIAASRADAPLKAQIIRELIATGLDIVERKALEHETAT